MKNAADFRSIARDVLRGKWAIAAIYIGLAILVIAVVYLILGSVIELGYSRFILELVDRREKKSFVCFSSTICSTIFPIAMTPFIYAAINTH